MKTFRVSFRNLLAVVFMAGQVAHADTVKVLTTGAFKQVVVAMVPGFEAKTGHRVVVQNDTAGALIQRIHAGESFDVLILTPGGLKTLGDRGVVDAGSIRSLAKVAIGVAVKSGAIKPTISTVDEFKQALAQAQHVAYIDPKSGGSSGIYLDQWFEKTGLAHMIRPKAVLVPGGLVAERLLTDQADLAIHQISEILPVKGVDLVGPLPEEIQNYTYYAAALSVGSQSSFAAKAFMTMITQTEMTELIRSKGMVPAP
jgi:molybdate transport system substrate-binding protein